ncbi:MAG: carboxypeptidase regulatory-like domain-containing protein [Acidobacteriaceae bacterium]|nr:carboxypeptidase regulatory-like domain-containing protein [Acidobacteriaceae bacterium]
MGHVRTRLHGVWANPNRVCTGRLRSTIRGTVTDPQGGVVPGATVTVTDIATGIPVAQRTDAHGSYTFNGLRPRTFNLFVDSNGFRRYACRRTGCACGKAGCIMNRWLDAVIGGWSVSSIFTFQSGQPIPIGMSIPRLADGNQRPNVTCSDPSAGISYTPQRPPDSPISTSTVLRTRATSNWATLRVIFRTFAWTVSGISTPPCENSSTYASRSNCKCVLKHLTF